MNRFDQYSALRRSTRTTPFELGAWMNWSSPMTMPTWEGPREVVLKNTRSPELRSRGLIFLPSPNCSSTERGSAMPLRANTYWVKPLQSNPPGSEPPFR